MSYGSSSEYENAAIALIEGGKPQQALDLFDEGLRKYPADQGLLLGRGMALIDLKRPADAREAFLALTAIAPQMTDALQGLAEAELALGNIPAAVEAAREACDRPEETSADFVHGVALLLYRHKLFADAEHCYQRAVGIDRAHGHSWLGLASCLHNQGKRGEAISVLKEVVVDRLPGFWVAYSYLGCMLYDAGRFEEADAILKKIPLDELRDPAAAKRLRSTLNVDEFPERARMLSEIERRAEAQLAKVTALPMPRSEPGTFVIGPIRGDFNRLLDILKHIRVVDEKGKWCGEHSRIVLIGPFLKKGRGKLKALRYAEKLQIQATRKSGPEAVVLVADPRETMERAFACTVNDEWLVTVPGLSSAAIESACSRVREHWKGGGMWRPPFVRELGRELAKSGEHLDGKPDSSSSSRRQICAAEGDPAARVERVGEGLVRLDSGLGDGRRLLYLRFLEKSWSVVELPLAQERFLKLKSQFAENFGMSLPVALEWDPKKEPLHPESDEWLAYSRMARSKEVRLPVFRDNFESAPKGTWLLGYWGYGANSYAFYFARKDQKRDVFLRLFYGGAYGDCEKDGVEVRTFLQRYLAFEEWAADHLQSWSIINDMGYCAGWIQRRSSTTREALPDGNARTFRFPNEEENPPKNGS